MLPRSQNSERFPGTRRQPPRHHRRPACGLFWQMDVLYALAGCIAAVRREIISSGCAVPGCAKPRHLPAAPPTSPAPPRLSPHYSTPSRKSTHKPTSAIVRLIGAQSVLLLILPAGVVVVPSLTRVDSDHREHCGGRALAKRVVCNKSDFKVDDEAVSLVIGLLRGLGSVGASGAWGPRAVHTSSS